MTDRIKGENFRQEKDIPDAAWLDDSTLKDKVIVV